MKPAILEVVIAVVAVLATFGDAHAQMFGSQSKSGTSASRLGAAGSTTSANEGSLIHGNERFIRGNRRAGDFIGGDARDRRGFVGTQRGGTAAAVAPAAAAVRILRQRNMNTVPATPVNRATGAYQPRVTIGFETPQVSSDAITATVARQLAATPGLSPANRIEVSVEGGTATLRGVVASERDRSLIERLLLFEPGISTVRNDLKVAPPTEYSGILPPSAQPPSKSPSDRPAGSPAAK